jgi:hypothetical protein
LQDSDDTVSDDLVEAETEIDVSDLKETKELTDKPMAAMARKANYLLLRLGY